jgi:hypothetical protein
MSDKKKDEAEAERQAVITDKWVEDHFIILTNIYITMIQAETDRFTGTRQVIQDFYKDAYGQVKAQTCI